MTPIFPMTSLISDHFMHFPSLAQVIFRLLGYELCPFYNKPAPGLRANCAPDCAVKTAMAPFTRSSPRINNNNTRSSSDTPSEPVRAAPASSKFRRKRGDRFREQSDIHEEAIRMRGSMGTTLEPSFTKVITGKTAHHSAYCCRLALPRRFCEEHKLPKHVSMTDSTGNRRWHMRFQLRRASRSFTISNGWREFSYDHNLETGDQLVFTLVSTSHFRVGFAASDGTRAMYPTRDGDEYPWKINYSRHDCLSRQQRNNRHAKKREERKGKDSQEETQLQILMQPPEARRIQGMEKATTFVQNIVSVLFPEMLKPTDENLQSLPAQSSEDRLPEGGQKHSQLKKPIVTIPNKPIISLPNESKEEEPQFCQCKTLPVMLCKHQPRSLKVPRITHVECKNPDGTTYLQIIDSDGELAD